MLPFASSSYLAQVRRLRNLAETALTRFPIRGGKLHFLNHAENTTFRVDAANGKKYLLRVHRDGYHSEAAIMEELSWLKNISATTELSVPSPIYSKAGTLLESVVSPGIPSPRFCAMFEWVPGKFIFKSTREQDAFQLGKLIAELQATTKRIKVKHRRYWDAEGLLGLTSPKFGSVQNLSGISAGEQKIISQSRTEIYSYLRNFEKKFPERQSMIHADLHFGNFLVQKESLGAIDFDDCGFGFHGYDLAVPIRQMHFLCRNSPKKRFLALLAAIQNGYASTAHWDQHDMDALPYFFHARGIVMLGWLQSRSENPALKRDLKKIAKKVVAQLKGKGRNFS
jgi:Ser/Thr protein kinase RdoA (MazF antagonist)